MAAGLPKPDDFGVDYRTQPSADLLFVRINDPVAITLQDLARRVQTRPGICWWADPGECMDLRDLPLDVAGQVNLSDQLRAVLMASPFVDDAQVTSFWPDTQSSSLTILCEVTTVYGRILRLQITATEISVQVTLLGDEYG